MTLAVKLLLIAALVLGIIIPFGTFLLGEKSKKRYKRTIGANAFFFFGAFVVAGIMLFSGMPAQAAEAAGTASKQRNRIWIPCSSTFNRFILCRRWYRSSKCSKRSTGSNQ